MKRVAAEGTKFGAGNLVTMYAKCSKIMIKKEIGGKRRIPEDWINICFRVLKNTAGVKFSPFAHQIIARPFIRDAPKILAFLSDYT